jgi:Mor family transcriptional regulator
MARRGRATRAGHELLAQMEAGVEASVFSRLEASLGGTVGKELLRDVAGRAGREAAEAVRIAHGGGHVYIPIDKARRDAALYADFSGDNHYELARRYHMAVNTVYKILRREKARRTMRQLTLMDPVTYGSTQ